MSRTCFTLKRNTQCLSRRLDVIVDVTDVPITGNGYSYPETSRGSGAVLSVFHAAPAGWEAWSLNFIASDREWTGGCGSYRCRHRHRRTTTTTAVVVFVLLKSQVWNLEGELRDYVEGEDLEFHVACEDAGLNITAPSLTVHGPRIHRHSLMDLLSSGPKPILRCFEM